MRIRGRGMAKNGQTSTELPQASPLLQPGHNAGSAARGNIARVSGREAGPGAEEGAWGRRRPAHPSEAEPAPGGAGGGGGGEVGAVSRSP